MFNQLMNLGDDLRIKPALAERLDNPDPLTYIATLRRGVKFHDGHELTAKDVVFTYGEMIDPSYVSPFKGAYRSLKSVTALDDYRVVFKLKEPFSAFTIQLAGPPSIVPAGSGPDFAEHPIGTGPYKFVRYAVDDQLVLAPFPDYFNGPPKNTGIVIRVLPDDTMRGLELRKGSIDLVVNDLPPDIVHQFEGNGFALAKSPGLDYSYLGINMRDPVLADKRVRHAIGYAIDRHAIVEYLRRGLARPATGLIPSQAWAYEPDIFQFTYDPNHAKQLLDEAGYKDPDGEGPLPRLDQAAREFALRGLGCVRRRIAGLAGHAQLSHALCQSLLHHFAAELEMQGRHQELVLVIFQFRGGLQNVRQRLVPGTKMGDAVGALVGLRVQHVRRQQVIYSLIEQRQRVSVSHLNRVARLGQRQLDPVGGDLLICRRREHHVHAQRREVPVPEGVPVEHGHRPRNPDHQFRNAGRGLRRKFLDHRLAVRQQVLDHGLPPGGRWLTELVRALVSPVALLAFNGEFLDVAEVRASLADKVARRHRQPG